MTAEPQPLHPLVERTEDVALRGILPIRIGEHTRNVPTLKMRHSSEWVAKAAKEIVETDIPDVPDAVDDMPGFIASLATLTTDRMLDLVLLYDRSGALGGRDFVLDNADPRDIYEALEAMATATFPFVTDPRVHSVVAGFGPQIRYVLTLALGKLAERLSRESDTSGPSSTGDSTPTPSTIASATSSSSSSGATASSARRAKRPTAST